MWLKTCYAKLILFAGLLMVMFLFCQFIPSGKIPSKGLEIKDGRTDPGFLQSYGEWVDSVFNSLSIEQRVAQMILVAAYSNNQKENESDVERLVRDQHIGGLVFFQGTPYRQAKLTNYYQSLAATPLLIAMDAEWGLGMRLDSTVAYPHQIMLGAIEDEQLIFDMGSQIAEQLKRLGVHVNFAPVADVNNNPENPVINSRSFGENTESVARKALLYMTGMEKKGVLSVAKHFPGHGDTNVDSHEELPVIYHTRSRIDSIELYPFRVMIQNGLPGIMTGHLKIPSLDPREVLPTSLSELVVDSLLKNSLGFKGLAFTDALGMKGISGHYKPVEAAELALLAGNDILLMPDDVPSVISYIVKQINRGKISQEEIDKRCRKILAAKYWAGLNNYSPVQLSGLDKDLNKAEYELLQRKLIESSLTLVQNRRNILPLRHLDTLKVASVILSEDHDTVFQNTLGYYMPVDRFYVKGDGSDNMDSILNCLKVYNLVIASMHSHDNNSARQYGINDCLIEWLDSLSVRQNVILNLFASPYVLNRMTRTEQLGALLVSYENSPMAQELSAQAIFGAISIHGILPVSVSHWKAFKSLLTAPELGRLKFTIPQEAGMCEDTLLRIDSLVYNAIKEQAIPGCQVLVARKGKIVMNKAYGTHMYNDKQLVSVNDIYDLASITKVAATTQALMRITDEDSIEIDQKLSAYLHYLGNTPLKDINIEDVLLHQSGLISSVQAYFHSLEPVFRNQKLISSTQTATNPVRLSYKQYLNKYTRYKDQIISPQFSEKFPLQIADHMYSLSAWPDTVYDIISKTRLNTKKEYVYSDIGFILLKQLVDSIVHSPMDCYLDSVFYRKLGAGRLCFNPLHHFSRDVIVPTEDDQIFRKQLIHGYVHDPEAAMLGGVSGHAGLFSNAIDLAKLFQMMLNGGEYAAEHFYDPDIVQLFTQVKMGIAGNRRGLGFDKPEPDQSKPSPSCLSASPSSYGQYGFTGTMVWVDPAYDLIYIFLSNRVYPDSNNNKLAEMNIRTNIQQVVYNAILK
jgi:beta-N-acetylhexosaminidase